MKSSAKKIELASVDDLFSTEEGRQDAKLEKIQEIPLSELHPFKNHPFKVKDDEAMMETADSIKQYGVLVPAIARPDPEGGYELVAGHRRHRASELADKETMPVIVRDLDDDAATIIMVDSNLQRESLLPSERAFAYKMKLDAMKHQGERVDLTSSQVGTKLRADEILAQQAGSSRNQIQRYIRLTELIPELLDMVDEKKIALNPAYELSFLKKEEQVDLLDAMDSEQATPSLSQAQRLKKYSQEGHLTLDKVGKKKVYMVSSEADAQGLIRADKHPKSTRYGRQNPISERWNSEEQLTAWRAAWADVSNRYLERAGREERIDHRSYADRGLTEQPTIHEGVSARAMEKKGIISDRCEINRQIKADNALLRELKAEIKKLVTLVARTVPAIAEGLEKLRSRVLIFCYQLSRIRSGKSHIQQSLAVWKPEMERYAGLVQQIKEKSKERKALVAEKKELPIYHVKRHKALAVRIAELTEDLEELCSEKALLLQKFEYAEDAGAEAFRKDIATMEAGLKKLETQEQKYSVELDKALTEYAELKAQAVDLDPVELYKARQAIRPAQEKAAEQQIEDAMHEKLSLIMLLNAKQEASRLLGEDADEREIRQLLAQRQRSRTKAGGNMER